MTKNICSCMYAWVENALLLILPPVTAFIHHSSSTTLQPNLQQPPFSPTLHPLFKHYSSAITFNHLQTRKLDKLMTYRKYSYIVWKRKSYMWLKTHTRTPLTSIRTNPAVSDHTQYVEYNWVPHMHTICPNHTQIWEKSCTYEHYSISYTPNANTKIMHTWHQQQIEYLVQYRNSTKKNKPLLIVI